MSFVLFRICTLWRNEHGHSLSRILVNKWNSVLCVSSFVVYVPSTLVGIGRRLTRSFVE